jgi:hypothetical protein
MTECCGGVGHIKTEEETSEAQHSEKMMVVHMDRLAPYQGTARDERP